ncbi:hypothetical protein [Clostridium isatidis]|uniref:Uncharacterized protein n=1 Tax=Clostridium isatidis TaxID=182773 RepID=A0A343JBB6_9CLOT|nr:hypothetical protein [Clostridium isatidis]ASW42824.1 hypothetical protein BEN51_04865 [Clostridium isatidis]NLZ34387.1 hypothetical protein [Clostridiales bacterium]
MEIQLYLKGINKPLIYLGDRIDILDFNLKGVEYKQIRVFNKASSKSELIKTELIKRIVEKK